VLAHPPVTAFAWTFRSSAKHMDNETAVDRKRFDANGTASRLAYVADSERDLGVLSCYAENTVGKMSAPCVFNLVAAGE
jgi:hypothetical protein